MDAAGHLAAGAVLVEQRATAKLRGCITRELATGSLPGLANRSRQQLVIELSPP